MMCRSRSVRRELLCLVAMIVIGAIATGDDTREQPIPLNMAMTTASLGNVRDADIIAAFKTYATELAKSRGLNVRTEVTPFDSVEELAQAVSQERIEILGLLTDEYLQLEEHLPYDLMYTPQKSGKSTETYVLLVHTNSGFDRIDQLEGKELAVGTGTQMGMARTWLDTKLMKSGLPESHDFFRNVRTEKKLSQAVLPVFFRSIDACLVTESGFQTIVEMNPQVGRRLRVLASSPEIVPFVTCFLTSFDGSNRELTERAFDEAHLEPHGQQILTLFRFDRVVPCASEDLESARQIMRAYERLKGLAPPA